MSLPDTVRVKLSSEVAESIAITPVVVREIPIRELVEHMLGVAGKNEQRLHDLLQRGTLVSGASRFRWTGWEADHDALRALLASFPDPDPARRFAGESCFLAVLRGSSRRIEIPRDIGQRKPLFRRGSFWDTLMKVASGAETRYVDYSYRERADYFSSPIPLPALERLRAHVHLLKYTTLQQQIERSAIDTAELFTRR